MYTCRRAIRKHCQRPDGEPGWSSDVRWLSLAGQLDRMIMNSAADHNDATTENTCAHASEQDMAGNAGMAVSGCIRFFR